MLLKSIMYLFFYYCILIFTFLEINKKQLRIDFVLYSVSITFFPVQLLSESGCVGEILAKTRTHASARTFCCCSPCRNFPNPDTASGVMFCLHVIDAVTHVFLFFI